MTPVVHVVDDDASLRTALSRLLGAAGYEVREYATAGDYLLREPDPAPGCVLLDLNLPGASGLELQAALERHPAHARAVVFLTGAGNVPSSVQAMKAGACDFLTKPVDRTTLLRAVEGAVQRDVTEHEQRERASALRASIAALSARETHVLRGIVAGKLNKQLAAELGIAERTVRLDRASVMRSIGARSLSELMHALAAAGIAKESDDTRE